MRMSQGKGEVQKRGSPEDMLHLPHRARNDLAATFHRASKQKVTCEQAPRATKQVRAVSPSYHGACGIVIRIQSPVGLREERKLSA